jgi:hypothetical protein
MTPFGCTRERELTSQLRLGQWPQASPAELRAHVAACRTCSDLVLVSAAMQAARTVPTPLLPSAGALWWRAQLRRRNQAIERISRPFLGAQIFALVVAALVGIAGAGWALRNTVRWLAWFGELPHTLNFGALLPTALPGAGSSLWFLLPMLATLAIAGGIAVYFTLEKLEKR